MSAEPNKVGPPRLNELATAVAKQRESKKLTIRALAEELGEPHPTIQHVEHGRMPRPEAFLKLMRWLGKIDDVTYRRVMKYAKEKPND